MGERGRSWRVVVVVAALALGVGLVGFLWFTAGFRAAGQAHDDAVALWESKEPAAYSFVYGRCGGMCAVCRMRVTVEDGRVTGAVTAEGQCSSSTLEDAPSIEDVFAMEKSDRGGAMTHSFEIT
ncbi:MAG: DUF6174 domain-containing protein [Nocardioides sp.]